MYYFENGGDPIVYLGSADLMERNLDRRVEALCPVLEAYLTDTKRTSVLRSDGTYHSPEVRDASIDAQQLLVSPGR